MNYRQFRLALAGGVVCITPALVYLWLQFFVSGATYYDGHREGGHVFKYLWLFVVEVLPVSVTGTLLAGLAAIWIAKRWGRLRTSRLVASSATLGLLGAISLVLLLPFPPAGRIVLPVAAAGLAAALALEFAIVAGAPWRQGDASTAPRGLARAGLLLDRAAVVTAAIVGAGSILLLGSLIAVTLKHGCDCG
jgi:hypothetical protein